MNIVRRFGLPGFSLLLLAATVTACGSASSSSGDANGGASAAPPSVPATSTTDPNGDPQRAIAEADIIQLDGNVLYAMSKSGTVSVVDVSVPGRLTMLGQTTLPGQPFEMYLRGNVLIAMSNGARDVTGAFQQAGTTADANGGAAVTAIDVSTPGRLRTLTTLAIPGEVADSRIVGDVLYMATYENAQCYGCGLEPRTIVTSFGVADPTALRQVDQTSFESNAPDQYNLPWGSAWKRSILATPGRLYVGGHADIAPSDFYGGYGTTGGAQAPKEGIIDVLDITDPTGLLVRGARLQVAGAVLSRWQFDEQAGVLRVVSQAGAGRTGNGVAMPEIETFQIASTQSFVPLGHATMRLPSQEGLRTVRFDVDRAYAITYNQTDPLFAIDLSNPATPAQRGQLSMPGFMFYLEPHGDRVIGLGVDRADPGGSLNVSLFDVSNLDAPRMITRVPFGTADIGEDYQILNYELPEDQDRIQKSFRVFADGLVAVPFTATNSGYSYGSPTGCANMASGVQLVEWAGDTLTKRTLLPVAGNPRRAFETSSEIITVSDSNVRSFSLASLDRPMASADLVIGTCVADVMPVATYSSPPPNYYAGGQYSYGRPLGECTVVATGARNGGVAWAGGLLVLAAVAFGRRGGRRTTSRAGHES